LVCPPTTSPSSSGNPSRSDTCASMRVLLLL
jgi:hypothetical protein